MSVGTEASSLVDPRVRALQRRVRVVLVVGESLVGVGVGATFVVGTLIADRISGSAWLAGLSVTVATVGGAAATVPLAALASRWGRGPALAAGALVAVLGAALGLVGTAAGSFAVLLVGFALLGVGGAVGMQSRFAAVDLALPEHRSRDLSIVVWAITIGAFVSPHLVGPGDAIGRQFGLPELSGVFLFAIGAQLACGTLYLVALRPDPLRLSLRLAGASSEPARGTAAPVRTRYRLGVLAMALANAGMVSIMSMTPVHLADSGAGLSMIGLVLSLHIAGMFGLSPVMGILADRLGRPVVVVVGQALMLVALVLTWRSGEDHALVLVGLTLVGLGWSASMIAGAALVAENSPPGRRTRLQGRADLLVGAAGALGGAVAGPILAFVGYAGLSLATAALVLVVFIGVGAAVRDR